MPLTPAGDGKWKAWPGGPVLPSKKRAKSQAAAIKINQKRKGKGPVSMSEETVDIPFPDYEEEDGRIATWVKVIAEPGFTYEGKDWKVTPEFIDQQVKAYEALQRGGFKSELSEGEEEVVYDAPIRIAHKDRGSRFGDVLGLARAKLRDGKNYMLAAVHWGKQMSGAIERGELRYTSPGFKSGVEDEGGTIHPVKESGAPFVLTELSVTDAPHQKRVLGKSHLLSEGSMPPEHNEEEEGPTMEEQVTSLAETVAGLAEAIAPLKQLTEALMGEDEDEAEEEREEEKESEMSENSQIAALQEKVAALTERISMSESARFQAEVEHHIAMREGSSLSLSDESVQAALMIVAESNPEIFEKVLKGAQVQKEVKMTESRRFFGGLDMTLGEQAPAKRGDQKVPISPVKLQELQYTEGIDAARIAMSEDMAQFGLDINKAADRYKYAELGKQFHTMV